jgi:hypothetical protein
LSRKLHVISAETLYRPGEFDWLQQLWETGFDRVEARSLDYDSGRDAVVFDAFFRVWHLGNFDHRYYRGKYSFSGLSETGAIEEKSAQGGSLDSHGLGSYRNECGKPNRN